MWSVCPTQNMKQKMTVAAANKWTINCFRQQYTISLYNSNRLSIGYQLLVYIMGPNTASP